MILGIISYNIVLRSFWLMMKVYCFLFITLSHVSRAGFPCINHYSYIKRVKEHGFDIYRLTITNLQYTTLTMRM